jgi:hypothetical protein
MVMLVVSAFLAGPVRANPPGVVKESGRTAVDAVRDGALTFGRTVRDFFVHGPRTAGETWRGNAAETKSDARSNAARVEHEAHDER